MSLDKTSIQISVWSGLTNVLAAITAKAQLPFSYKIDLTDGTGNNQANEIWSDQRTIGASGAENLDLNGVLTNALGSTVSLTKVKALIIVADANNTNDVIVGNAASNGFISWCGGATHTVTVRPGGFIVLGAPGAGYAVTAGSADQLKIANSGAGTSVTYKIIIIGVE